VIISNTNTYLLCVQGIADLARLQPRTGRRRSQAPGCSGVEMPSPSVDSAPPERLRRERTLSTQSNPLNSILQAYDHSGSNRSLLTNFHRGNLENSIEISVLSCSPVTPGVVDNSKCTKCAEPQGGAKEYSTTYHNNKRPLKCLHGGGCGTPHHVMYQCPTHLTQKHPPISQNSGPTPCLVP